MIRLEAKPTLDIKVNPGMNADHVIRAAYLISTGEHRTVRLMHSNGAQLAIKEDTARAELIKRPIKFF